MDLTFPGALEGLAPCAQTPIFPLHTSDPLFSFPEFHADPRLTTCHSASMTNLLLMPRCPKACRKRDRREGRGILGHQLKNYRVLHTARLYIWGVPATFQPPLACFPFHLSTAQEAAPPIYTPPQAHAPHVGCIALFILLWGVQAVGEFLLIQGGPVEWKNKTTGLQ